MEAETITKRFGRKVGVPKWRGSTLLSLDLDWLWAEGIPIFRLLNWPSLSRQPPANARTYSGDGGLDNMGCIFPIRRNMQGLQLQAEYVHVLYLKALIHSCKPQIHDQLK